jgi:hypothetical protein
MICPRLMCRRPSLSSQNDIQDTYVSSAFQKRCPSANKRRRAGTLVYDSPRFMVVRLCPPPLCSLKAILGAVLNQKEQPIQTMVSAAFLTEKKHKITTCLDLYSTTSHSAWKNRKRRRIVAWLCAACKIEPSMELRALDLLRGI